jgi:hypothetical protein
MQFPLAIQSSRDADHIAANPERLVNVYSTPIKGGHELKSVLGEELLTSVSSVFLRAMDSFNGSLYAVTEGKGYKFSASNVASSIGSITDDAATDMASNFDNVCITAGGDYYVYDGTALSNPTAGNFTEFGSVTYLKSYTILTEKDGSQFCWSDIADPATLPALNFASTESRDDDIIRAKAFGGNLWLFGVESIEIWYPTGLSGADAFQLISGAVIDTGLKAFNLVTRCPGGLFFVGNDGIAYLTSGAGLQPVSTAPVATAIDQGEATNCFYYEDEGSKFCVVRFADRPAWVYDLTTGKWAERATGAVDAWRSVVSTLHGNSWLVGTDSGSISTLTRSNSDDDQPLIRTIISDTVYNDGQRFKVPEFEVTGNIGQHNVTDVETRAPKMMVRTSRDGGVSWGRERVVDVGSLGKYSKRVIMRALGQFRRFTIEFRYSDPVDVTLDAKARIRAS